MKVSLLPRLAWLLASLLLLAAPLHAQNLNLAQGKTATASSLEYPYYPAANATDGDHATRWSSQFADPQSLVVDLGAVQSIDRVRLSWETAYASNFTLDVSNDAITWTTVRTVSGNAPVLRNGQYLNEFGSLGGSGRYVRMLGTARATPYGYSIYEFEVFSFTPGSLSLALGKSGVASDSQSDYPPAYAFDGKDDTRWSTLQASNVYLLVDLGSIADISRVYLSWEYAYGVNFLLQGSNNGQTWTTFATFSNNQAYFNEQAVAISSRYVRLLGQTGGQNNGGFSLYEFRIFGALTPLPVTLVGFTAQPAVGGAVSVRWTTASELNSAEFAVQRSVNGSDFSTLATVAAAGNSAAATAYAYLDRQPLPTLAYYRLRQLDRDGSVAYGPTVAVGPASPSPDPSVYPNPVAGPATLSWSASGPHAGRWYLRNSLGQVVRAAPLQGDAGLNSQPLELGSGVAAGSYLLTVEVAGQVPQRTRIQVQ